MWIRDGNKLVLSSGLTLQLSTKTNTWRIWYSDEDYRQLETEETGLFILNSITTAICKGIQVISLDRLCEEYEV